MTHRFLAGILASLLLSSPLPVLAEESPAARSGTDHTLTWELADHVLTIRGSGAIQCEASGCDDDAGDYPAWHPYAAEITAIRIEEGVTGAEAYALADYPNLQSISLPSTFTCLEPYALYGDAQLSEIQGIESVTEWNFDCLTGTAWVAANPFVIHDGKLYYAEGTDLHVPDGVTEIMPYAFGNLTGTRPDAAAGTVVTLPDSVEIIHENAFAFCTHLTAVTLPEGLREIGDHAFYNCANLGSLRLGANVTEIGTQAFWGCRSLTTLTITNPDAVIGEDAYGDVYDWAAVIRANPRYSDAQRERLLARLAEDPTLLDVELSQFAIHFRGTRRYSDISYRSLPYDSTYLIRAGTISGALDSNAQHYADEKRLPFAPLDGSPLPGDVNLDGFVDIMDVIALNRYLLGKALLSDRAKLAADLSEDDSLDDLDALEILRYVVGIR